MHPRFNGNNVSFDKRRLSIWYLLILLAFAAIGIKLFYIQVLQHQNYKELARAGQFKEFEIPSDRGVILAYDGSRTIPIVLNQDTYTLFADPKYIENADSVAGQITQKIGGNASEYAEKMKLDTRYSVLAKKLNQQQKNEIDSLNIKGIGTRNAPVRTYPNGNLAAQILGFVNDEGAGTYGVEQFLDDKLKGQPGELKAITDAQGVPLVSAGSNVLKEPIEGERITLTIDISMQRRVEALLKPHIKSLNAKSGSVIVIDPYSGAIKAMANYPTFSPEKFYEVKDASIFTNPAVSKPLEVGSIMKTLTVAAGLNEGVIKPNGSYYDPAAITIDNETIRNVEEDGGAAQRSIADILRYSLNTGAVHVLKQMGGGEVNEKARITWSRYLTEKYGFGMKTGIEQGYEAEGSVPNPKEGYGLNIQYANSSFGQGITVTPLQMISAYISTINGGNYYRPHVVEGAPDKNSYLVRKDVVSPSVSASMRRMHENSAKLQYPFITRDGYRIGGKTGTAEIPNPSGGYYKDKFNGTFIGYVGGDKPEYAIIVIIDEPVVDFYAGTAAAAPMFAKVSNMLIDNFSVRPATR